MFRRAALLTPGESLSPELQFYPPILEYMGGLDDALQDGLGLGHIDWLIPASLSRVGYQLLLTVSILLYTFLPILQPFSDNI